MVSIDLHPVQHRSAHTWKLELLSLPSTTMTDAEFLRGETRGSPVTLTAALRLPSPIERVPAVILLHGSAGLSGHVDEWAGYLNGLGVAALLVDSFTARGIELTLANQGLLGRLAMIIDAYRAFDVLVDHPRIDARRIALMGFSRGGQAALYAAVQRFRGMHGPTHGDFAAHIAFYPSCHTRFIEDDRVLPAPIHVLHGAADKFNSIIPTRDYIRRVQAAGGAAQLHEFDGAEHVFDWPLLQEPVALPGVRANLAAHYEERERGVLSRVDEAEAPTVPRFAYNDAAFHAARSIVATVVRETLLG